MYLKNLGEKFKQILRRYSPACFESIRPLSCFLNSGKDVTRSNLDNGVYSIPCSCGRFTLKFGSYLNLSFIIALESGIEPHISYNLLFEIRSVSWVPRTIRRNLSGKHLVNFHPLFGGPIL